MEPALFRELFYILKRAVLPLRKAVLSPLQDTDVIVTAMSVMKRPSHKGRHTNRVVIKNSQRHLPPTQDFL